MKLLRHKPTRHALHRHAMHRPAAPAQGQPGAEDGRLVKIEWLSKLADVGADPAKLLESVYSRVRTRLSP